MNWKSERGIACLVSQLGMQITEDETLYTESATAANTEMRRTEKLGN